MMKQRHKKYLEAGIVLAAIALGLAVMISIGRMHAVFWEGTAQTPAGMKDGNFRIEFLATLLPAKATDIHYYVNFNSHYYASFHVSEQEFLNWAAHIESTLIARNAVGQTIKKLRRVNNYYGFRPLYPEPGRGQYGEVSFTTGYYTEVTRTTKLTSVELFYDSDKQRAYLLAQR